MANNVGWLQACTCTWFISWCLSNLAMWLDLSPKYARPRLFMSACHGWLIWEIRAGYCCLRSRSHVGCEIIRDRRRILGCRVGMDISTNCEHKKWLLQKNMGLESLSFLFGTNNVSALAGYGQNWKVEAWNQLDDMQQHKRKSEKVLQDR